MSEQQLDYKNLTTDTLSPVVKWLDNAGAEVLKDESGKPKIEADNKQVRIKGQPTKQAAIYFTDAQSLTLMVSPDGVVYQWKLNGKVIPVRNMDNLAAAVKEVAAKVAQNSTAFTKKLARQEVKAHRNDWQKTSRVSNAIPARLKAVKFEIEDARSQLDTAQKAASEQQQVAAGRTAQVSELESTLNSLKARNGELQAEYDELRKAA